MTRPPEEVARVRELDARGMNRCEIARVTGIPRRTISGWLNGHAPACSRHCFRCSASMGPFPRLVEQAYAYLFGLYLGDGCILRQRRSYELRITLDERYSVIIQECETAMALVMPANKISLQSPSGERCVQVRSFSKHWPCLFPQHGPGPKHERRIELAPWQREVCDRYTWRFLRGLVHSDGSRFMNTIRHPQKTYAYPRYNFTNHSDDIRRVFCEH